MRAAEAAPPPPLLHPAGGGEGSPGRGALLVVAAILLAYANALLWGEFQFDDFNVIVDNPGVHAWPAWWNDLGRGIRPLLKFSYTLDWTLGGGAVLPFHLSNIAIHCANAVLVLMLARRYAAARLALRPHAEWIAACAALIFALHPIHSETVTYVSGRSAALMTMFYLAGLLAYASGRSVRDAPSIEAPRTALRLHLLVPFCFVLALAVKETAVTFPFALLLWELGNGGNLKHALRRQWSVWLLLALGALYFLGHPGYAAHLDRSATFNDFAGNLASTALGTAWLLRQWVAPFWLNIDPDLPVLRDIGSEALPPLLLLLALAATTFLSWRRRPWLAFALAWLLLQLVPLHLFLPRLDVANERQMLLAGWPLALLLATELALRLKDRPRMRLAVAVALLMLCLALTIARNADYRNEIALWQATARTSPDKARVRNNLGYAYAQDGRTAEAQAEYRRALLLNPRDFRARHNLKRLETEDSPPPSP